MTIGKAIEKDRSTLASYLLLLALVAFVLSAPAYASDMGLDAQGGGGAGGGSVTGGSCGSQAVTGIHPEDAIPTCAAPTPTPTASPTPSPTPTPSLRHLVFPFGTCNAGTAGTGWNLPASNAASPACSADDQTALLNFAAGTIAYAHASLPDDYVQVIGGMLNFYSSSDTTSGHTAIFSIATYCTQPNNGAAQPSSPTYNTAASVTTTIPSSASSTDLYQAIFPAPSMTGCAPGYQMRLRLSRSGADTMTGNAGAAGWFDLWIE